MKDALIEEITDCFVKSDYSMCAPGMRNASYWEVFEVIKIIKNSDASDVFDKLKSLHKYRPETIEMNKSSREYSCDSFNESVCDCFLPDVGFDDCYCKRQRKEYLATTDYRNTLEYNKWRTSVFERDEYTCQKCGVVGGDLNAHHIKKFKDYPENRYETENGKTLCVSCHKKEHRAANT